MQRFQPRGNRRVRDQDLRLARLRGLPPQASLTDHPGPANETIERRATELRVEAPDEPIGREEPGVDLVDLGERRVSAVETENNAGVAVHQASISRTTDPPGTSACGRPALSRIMVSGSCPKR